MDYRRALTSDGLDEFVYGDAAADTIDGGAGNDWLVGGEGADVFVFRSGSGSDVIVDFHSGIDTISMHGISQRTTMLSDSPEGMHIDYGSLGGSGPGHILLWNVHAVAATDFAFV